MGLVLDVGYASLLTAAAPYIAVRAARTGRYREGWAERILGRVPQLSGEAGCIWMHGVSLGEVQLLRPLVEHFDASGSQRRVVLSTSTLTGMQVAKRSLPGITSFYCPLDFSWAIKQALTRLQPRLIVLGELEVWPHLIGIATARNIPVAVVNGRLSDRSFRGYSRFRGLLHPTFSRLSLVAAQDATTAQRFCDLGVAPERVHVSGSLKFDNVNADRLHPEVVVRRQLVGLKDKHRIVVVGSTQDPEEQAALKAIEQLLPKHPDLKLIVVPRHPERFDEVDQLLRQGSLKVLRRSQIAQSANAEDWQVLLVDTVGELKWWWGVAELALVGGSFGSRGGQNMLEPAAYGARVAFGPNVWNFREIVRSLLEKDAVWQLPSLDALTDWINDSISDPLAGQNRPQRAMELIRSHQGATDRTCRLLESLLKSTGSS